MCLSWKCFKYFKMSCFSKLYGIVNAQRSRNETIWRKVREMAVFGKLWISLSELSHTHTHTRTHTHSWCLLSQQTSAPSLRKVTVAKNDPKLFNESKQPECYFIESSSFKTSCIVWRSIVNIFLILCSTFRLHIVIILLNEFQPVTHCYNQLPEVWLMEQQANIIL